MQSEDGTCSEEVNSEDPQADVQSRVYHNLEELQKMAQSIPRQFQQRLPTELLSVIAAALAQGQIFEIVEALLDVQQATEKNLFQQRLEFLHKHTVEKKEFQEHYKSTICSSDESAILNLTKELDKQEEIMKKRHKEQLKQSDMRLILQLDQKLMDQQVTLEKAGLPGFHVTNEPNEIRLQMYLLDFIRRLNPNKRLK
uniref:DGCR6 n=1 Tax=Caligus clemensi TaxID=344056 RepID=C1C284_CALCM|nr:DGCR6 [Caligus clemensi]